MIICIGALSAGSAHTGAGGKRIDGDLTMILIVFSVCVCQAALFGLSPTQSRSNDDEDEDDENEEDSWMAKFPDGTLLVVSGVRLPKEVAGADPPWAYPLYKIKQDDPSEQDVRRMLGWFEGQPLPMVCILHPRLIMPQFHCCLQDIRSQFEDKTVEILCRFICSGVCSLVGSPPSTANS